MSENTKAYFEDLFNDVDFTDPTKSCPTRWMSTCSVAAEAEFLEALGFKSTPFTSHDGKPGLLVSIPIANSKIATFRHVRIIEE
jgi:hypothetical protein